MSTLDKLSSIGLPGLSTGILQPKLCNRFAVVFMAAFNETPPAAEELLRTLGTQLVKVKLPPHLLTAVRARPVAPLQDFSHVTTTGSVSFEFEDDVGGQLSAALAMIFAAAKVNALVMKLDGNDGVLEAMFLERLNFERVEETELDYASSTTVRKIVTANTHYTQCLNQGILCTQEELLTKVRV
jgi:hypothetical protein